MTILRSLRHVKRLKTILSPKALKILKRTRLLKKRAVRVKKKTFGRVTIRR